jgi:hypothetical protein
MCGRSLTFRGLADAGDNSGSPTWAQPSADGSSIYVACNKSSEIVEVNANHWKLVQTLKTVATDDVGQEVAGVDFYKTGIGEVS